MPTRPCLPTRRLARNDARPAKAVFFRQTRCVITQRLDAPKPNATPAKTSSPTDAVGGASTVPTSNTPLLINPATMNPFRTLVGVAPARIHRSDSRPQMVAEIAAAKK